MESIGNDESLYALPGPSNISMSQSSSSVSANEGSVKLMGINSTKMTQNSCFLCGKKSGRSRIPATALMQAWRIRRIKIPRENRCCSEHLVNGKLTPMSLQLINPSKEYTTMSAEAVTEFIHDLTDEISKSQLAVDFNTNSNLTSDNYKLLLGITREQFDDLMTYCKTVKSSPNRSSRNAVAMLLMKLRLNVSQRVLAHMFHVENISVVSDAIDSVSKILETNFVPKFLGYDHVTREDVLELHSVPAFQTLLEKEDDQLILILDGTYLYVQKPSDFELQRKLYSSHKHRHLLKTMMVITTTGKILECEGLFAADGNNNDSRILESMLKAGTSSVLNFLEIGDVMVLDRGFRDVVEKLEDYALYVHMPNLLKKKQKQFTDKEGNQSRQVTMERWLVEAVNGRLKNKFSFFDCTIRNSYIPKLRRFLRIACALINAYSPPIFEGNEEHTHIVQLALARMNVENELQKFLEESNIMNKRAVWLEATNESVPLFPKLSTAELKELTLGNYQLNMAVHYTKQHMSESTFKIFVHNENNTLIRVKMQSRFCKSQKHNLWIKFVENGTSPSSIISWYCQCKTGARTVGCCSHVATVLWYLSFARHNPNEVPKKRDLGEGILDALELCAEDSDASEDENNEEVESNST